MRDRKVQTAVRTKDGCSNIHIPWRIDVIGYRWYSKTMKAETVLDLVGGRIHGCAVSTFVVSKSDLVKSGLEFLQDLMNQGIKVSAIRCDNAAENIQCQYTAPGTPQQNGVLEQRFATL